MKTDVHILATHLEGESLKGLTLVFKTLRIGFPTSSIKVWGNGLNSHAESELRRAASDCDVYMTPRIAHDLWIARLLDVSDRPFWICDTDIVFHSPVEGFPVDGSALAGRYEPAFIEPWSKTNKVDRLHTSLLRFDPNMIKGKVREWLGRYHPKGFPFLPDVELIRQHYVPVGSKNAPLFYDTCAGLYQAIGGLHFSDDQNKAFDHLHCGSYVRRMKGAVPGLAEAHEAIYSGVVPAEKIRESQSEFYRRHYAD